MLKFNKIYNSLLNGNISDLTVTNIISINDYIYRLLNKDNLTEEELDNIQQVLVMSNILWNNTDKDMLILDSGVYDLLLEKYYLYRPNDNSLVGAPPINFDTYNEELDVLKQEIIEPITFADSTDKFYMDDLMKVPKLTADDLLIEGISFDEGYSERRLINTSHNYPNLVGTITKAKFVLNKQAKDVGVYDDPKVKIFERDFLGYHIKNGFINPNEPIKLLFMLKYDGVSVEADIKGDMIIGARSRGDTANDLATDLTPILYGYHFIHAQDIDKDYEFGMKFEAIMTFENLKRYNEVTGSNYKNCRTAISGLFNRKDAYLYRDYITLVPLATSLEIDRETELEFMNRYYHSGVLMKYVIEEGSYIDILFRLKTFVDEAEYTRDYLNFMYDGVVVEYVDEQLKQSLGRKNSINQYQYAVKFNPLKAKAYVTGLSFTVGKDGVITPMIHYTPVEFIGTTHTKSTLHSYDRYLEERPAIGKICDVVYQNDVMPYVTIPNNSYNEDIEELIPYIDKCPCCGEPLILGDSGKNWYCVNMDCTERNVRRMADFLITLNIKGFGYETLNKLGITSFRKLLSLTPESTAFLGPVNSQNLMNAIDYIMINKISEDKIIGGLGFTGMSYTTWGYILSVYTLKELCDMIDNDPESAYNNLIKIKGIGDVTARTVINEYNYFKPDIMTILTLENVYPIKGQEDKPSVRFTNCRDKDLVDYLNSIGYDADDKKGVTKTTTYLIVPFEGFNGPSGKYDNAIKYGTKIVPIQEFKNMVKYA